MAGAGVSLGSGPGVGVCPSAGNGCGLSELSLFHFFLFAFLFGLFEVFFISLGLSFGLFLFALGIQFAFFLGALVLGFFKTLLDAAINLIIALETLFLVGLFKLLLLEEDPVMLIIFIFEGLGHFFQFFSDANALFCFPASIRILCDAVSPLRLSRLR